MYLLALFALVIFILFLLGTNWPVKLYHYWRLKQIAAALGVSGLPSEFIFASVIAEVKTTIHDHTVRIRFVDAGAGALRAASGLEIRVRKACPVVAEIYPLQRNKGEWGEFKRFMTGDPSFDAQWMVLTPEPEKLKAVWDSWGPQALLTDYPAVAQVSITHEELIIRVKLAGDSRRLVQLINTATTSETEG